MNKFWQPGSPLTAIQLTSNPEGFRFLGDVWNTGCSWCLAISGAAPCMEARQLWKQLGCGFGPSGQVAVNKLTAWLISLCYNELPCPCNPHCCQDVRVNDRWLVLVACADDVIYTSERMALAWNVGQFRGEKRSGEVNRCFEWYDLMLRYVRGICISSMAWQYTSRPHRQTLLLPSWNLERSAVRFTGHRVTWKSLISFWYFLVTAD